MKKRLLLLAGDRLGLAFAGARIGVRALAADRKAPAMAKPAVAGEVHQPLDVHGGLAAKVAFDREILVDRFTDVQDFLVGQVLDTLLGRDAELLGDLLGRGAADTVNVGQRDFDALVGGDVDPGNTSHSLPFFLAPRGANRPISSLEMPATKRKTDARKNAPPEP